MRIWNQDVPKKNPVREVKNELEEQKVRTLFSFCSGGHWSVSLLLTAYPGFESRPGGISNSTVIVPSTGTRY